MKEMVLYLLSHTCNREGCFTGHLETASLYSYFVKHALTVDITLRSQGLWSPFSALLYFWAHITVGLLSSTRFLFYDDAVKVHVSK